MLLNAPAAVRGAVQGRGTGRCGPGYTAPGRVVKGLPAKQWLGCVKELMVVW